MYATWEYAEQTAPSQEIGVGLNVGEFYYPPEEVLPDDVQDSQLGQNHLDLLQLILWEDSKGYGLNINKKPIVHNYLKNPGDVVYCDQNVSGGNLKFMLDENQSVNKLFFCIEKVSDTEYLCYTFSYYEMIDAVAGKDSIVVYRTTLIKENGVWDDVLSAVGYAKVINVNVNCGSSIDVTTWKYGEMPKNV